METPPDQWSNENDLRNMMSNGTGIFLDTDQGCMENKIKDMSHLAARMADIESFHVMDILARARALEAQGRDIVHMEIGEPDFPSPPAVIEAGIAALRAGHTHYTPTLGLPELRAAIAASYPLPARPDPARVVATPGSSGALALVFGVLIGPGDGVLMADPGYPCNRNFVRLYEGTAQLVPVDASTSYQLTAELIARHWTPATRAVLISSPSNPTGTLVPDTEMTKIAATVRARGGVLIVDEIYHGLTYGVQARSALQDSADVFVVNSFSKYYGMTGWRVGWLVAPLAYIETIDRLAQNIFLAASTPAQYAALAAFQPEVLAELDRRRAEFRARRDYLVPALRALGFGIPVIPEGAFYLYADSSRLAADSEDFAQRLLEEAGVAITPGRDFGSNAPKQHVRFSYANTRVQLEEGVRRIAAFLGRSTPGI
jgi:aspartate/methionine/tyrosine aminotransferase